MAEIGALKITFAGGEAMSQSLASLFAFADALDGGGEAILGDLVALCEASRCFVVNPIDAPAGGAGELQALRVLPDERYLELVSAVAARFNADVTFISHWPILRASSSLRTMAERRDGSNAVPAGGLA